MGRNGIENMLIAQCPNCGASFQVSMEQLQAASGRLQCGECGTVFDAEDHLNSPNNAGEDALSVEIDLDAEVERERLAALSARNDPSALTERASSDDAARGPSPESENLMTGEAPDQPVPETDASDIKKAASLAPSMDEKAESDRSDEASINLEELPEDEVSLSVATSEEANHVTESGQQALSSAVNEGAPKADRTAEEDQAIDGPPQSADKTDLGSDDLDTSDGASATTGGYWILVGLVVLAAAQLAYLLSH